MKKANYDNKKDANAVGGVFMFFILLAVLIIFALSSSENDYNARVAEGEDFSSHDQWEEEYTGDTFGEWFNYVFEEN